MGVSAERSLDELTLVIPVYNEGANFPSLWEAVSSQSSLAGFARWWFTTSTKTTPFLLSSRLSRKGEQRLVLVKNDVGRGVVGAIRTGFNRVEQGPVLVVMADLSDDLSQVDTMVEYYRQGYQVVVASRYMRGGRLLDAPPLKGLMSRCAGVTLHWFRRIPTHDATNAFKLYDSQVLKGHKHREQGGLRTQSRTDGESISRRLPHCRDPHNLAQPHARRVTLSRLGLAAAISEVVFLRLPPPPVFLSATQAIGPAGRTALVSRVLMRAVVAGC